MAGKTAQVGWQPFLAFLAFMNISIGLLNLLPFPMLDGVSYCMMHGSWSLVSGFRHQCKSSSKKWALFC
ncbi:site-2 protease family protein [Polynucleobacter necessarius]|uniref:site-2 protease family protein n=1 Tax=Polynucleobacter necessarius TaxID=576610 RepID=UPI001E42E307|nr:site-2 protease family protein [Polynucleobacter necessarius]